MVFIIYIKNSFLEMKNVWARTEIERKRSINCESQEVLSSVYITRNCVKLSGKVNSLAEHWQTQELVVMEKL